MASNGSLGSVAGSGASAEVGQQGVRGEEGKVGLLQVLVPEVDRVFSPRECRSNGSAQWPPVPSSEARSRLCFGRCMAAQRPPSGR